MADINMSDSEFRELSQEDKRKAINGTLNPQVDEATETEQPDTEIVEDETAEEETVENDSDTSEPEADEADIPVQFKGKSTEDLEKIKEDQEAYKQRQKELLEEIQRNNQEISRVGNEIGKEKKQKEIKAVIKEEDDLLSKYDKNDIEAIKRIISLNEQEKQQKVEATRVKTYDENINFEKQLYATNPELHATIIPKAIEEVKKNPQVLYEPNWVQTYVMREVTNVLGAKEKPVATKKKPPVAAGTGASRTQTNVNLLSSDPAKLTQEQRKQYITLQRRELGLPVR